MIVDALEDDSLKRIVTELMISRHEMSTGWRKMGSEPAPPDPRIMADDCIAKIQLRSLDERIAETYHLMRDSELRGEDITGFKQEIMRMQRARKDVQGR